MKTNNANQSTVAITLDDIIFSDRNQAYGAYHLRKKYNKHLIFALLILVSILGTGYSVSLIISHFNIKPFVNTGPAMDTIVTFQPENIEAPKPERLQPDPTRELIRNYQNNNYSVVDTVPIQDSTFRNLLPTDPGYVNVPVDTTIVLAYVDTDQYVPNENRIFTHVEEPATFKNGDLEVFRNWVQKNITYPSEAINAKIEGKVFVSFVIDKNGEVSDAKVLRGVHPSIDNETLRVLLSSPKWKPAKQNGIIVKQLFSIPIKYTITN